MHGEMNKTVSNCSRITIHGLTVLLFALLAASAAFADDSGTLATSGSGTLQLGNDTQGITYTGATLTLDGTNTDTGATLTLSGATLSGSANIVTGGTLTLNSASNNTGGTLTGNSANNVTGGTLTLSGATTLVNSGGFFLGTLIGSLTNSSLVKSGTDTLTLSSAVTYTGGTTINGGTLVVSNSNALGTGAVTINAGMLVLQVGVTNSIVLQGGNLAQTINAGARLADAAKASSAPGGTQTAAEILDGTASSVASLQSNFAGISLASNDRVRLSDVFSISGVPVIDGVTGERDTFVLQLHIVNVNAACFLGWLDPATNQWVNAVYGNIEGTAFFAGDRAYNPLTDFNLGTYGVDTANNTAWAVIDHNRSFAIVPEPGTCALIALGGAAIFFVVRRKRQTT